MESDAHLFDASSSEGEASTPALSGPDVDEEAAEDVDEDDESFDADNATGGGIAQHVRRLDKISDMLQIATLDGMDYENDDPLERVMHVFRTFVGNDARWLGNGEQAATRLNDFFMDVWKLFKEMTAECKGEELIPVEYRRRFERIYETLYHIRDMLHRMRRVAMLEAPESTFLEHNQDLTNAMHNEQRDKKRNHANEFQMLATCWECECNAAFGVGYETEDNTNPFWDRPIGLDDETLNALGKHVRWTWNPPSTSIGDLRPYQRFVIYLLEQARLRGYRRHGESMYERIVTSHGRYTPAWSRVCDISEFVRGEVINRGLNFSNWNDATCEKGNLHAATEYMQHCIDPSLPQLAKSRRLYAFANGVYVTYIKLRGHVIDYFWSYSEQKPIPIEGFANMAAVKYFDRQCRFAEFTDEDWFDIPTPALTSIMQYQELDEDVQRWHWAFLGRLFHDVGELDTWQVAFFLRGVAQSGKSSIILFWKTFFEAEDVGAIANNIEGTFGWGVLADKLVCLGPELRGDFVSNVDQATLQSIISGEIVSLARKNKDPITLLWKAPLFLVGNDELIFKDSSGQIARRIASIEYMKRVTEVDSSLPQKLDAERDLIMIKANRAYLSAVNSVGTGEVWSKLPRYFKDIQSAGFQLNNSIAHFLANGNLVYDQTYKLPHKVFMKLYGSHLVTFGLVRLSWRKMNVTTVLAQRNITVSDQIEQADWHGTTLSDLWLKGVDVPDPSAIDIGALTF